MEVVKLLKPDSGGHMARIFAAYAWRAGSVEVLGLPSLPALVRDLAQYNGSGTLPAALNEEDLFLVRGGQRATSSAPPPPPLPPLSAASASGGICAALA